MSDTKKLIERLRGQSRNPWIKNWELCLQAADTIARLEAERDAARRGAMEECARIADAVADGIDWEECALEGQIGARSVADAIREAMEKP